MPGVGVGEDHGGPPGTTVGGPDPLGNPHRLPGWGAS